MFMKAIVDQDTCIGCGLCEGICPEVFKMEDDKAIVKNDPVPQSEKENCEKAMESCPVQAIQISS